MSRLPKLILSVPPLVAFAGLLVEPMRAMKAPVRARSQAAHFAGPLRVVSFPDVLRLLKTTDVGLGKNLDSLRRMRELAVAASSGVSNSADRAVLDTFFQAHRERIENISLATTFDDLRVLDGSADVLLEGPRPTTPPYYLDLPEATPEAFGLEDERLTTLTSAFAVLATLDRALDTVRNARADLHAAWERAH